MERYNLIDKILITLLPLNSLMLGLIFIDSLEDDAFDSSYVFLSALKGFNIITMVSVIAFILYEIYKNRQKMIDYFLLIVCVVTIMLFVCVSLLNINFSINYLKTSENILGSIIVPYGIGLFIYYYYVYDRVVYKKN